MQNILYSAVIILTSLWALGFFVLNLGALIHLVLLLAVIVVIIKIIKEEKIESNQ